MIDYQALFEGLPGSYLILAPDFMILTVSDSYLEATMTERNVIVGRPLFEVFPDNPAERDANGVSNLRASLETVLKSKRPHVMAVQKYDIRNDGDSDGEFVERYWSPVNSPILNENDEVSLIVHRVEDVTEFIQATKKREEQHKLNATLKSRAEQIEAEMYRNAQALQDVNKKLSAANEARAQLAAIVDSTDVAIVSLSLDGVITSWNGGAQRLYGYNSNEVVGGTLDMLAVPGPDCKDRLLHDQGLLERLRRGEHINSFELRSLCKDGSLVDVSVTMSPIFNANGQVIGASKIARDITAAKAADRKLREQSEEIAQKNASLEAANNLKSEFLANMSHELRTPLNAIIGFSEVLKDGLLGTVTEEQRKYLGNIYSSGEHLLSLINDILDLSKIEAGKMEMDLEPINLESLLSNALEIIKERAATHRIEISMGIADDLKSGKEVLQADARMLKQTLYNLLANAVKFSNDGGVVQATAYCVARAQVGMLSDKSDWPSRMLPLGGESSERYVQISVRDGGIGIAETALDKLFLPFSQVESGVQRKFEGTGLGLAMVKKLVDLHGGTVGVASKAGVGTIFTVWLPLIDPQKTAANVSRGNLIEQKLSDLRQKENMRTALIVEDDNLAAEIIRFQLESEGFGAVAVSSVEDAVALVTRHKFNVVTLDIVLSETTGWEFLAHIKQIPTLADVPVIVISVAADDKKSLAFGAAAVLQKPVSREALREVLAQLPIASKTGY